MSAPDRRPVAPALRSRRRRILLVGGAVVAALVALAAVAHLGPVRRSILARVSSMLADQGFTVVAADLEYNLLTLRFRLTDLSVGAAGRQPPFFRAESVAVDLPWALPGRTIAIQELWLEAPVIDVVHGAGVSNLPGGEAGFEGAVRIDRIVVNDAAVRVGSGDASLALLLENLGLRVDDGGDVGQLTAPTPARLQLPNVSLELDVGAEGLGWTGQGARLRELGVSGAPGEITLDGDVGVLGDAGIDLGVEAAVSLADAAELLAEPGSEGVGDLAGRLELAGNVDGTIGDPRARFRITGALRSGALELRDLRADVVVGLTRVRADSFSLATADGTVSGSGEIGLDDGAGTVTLEWADVDLRALAALAGPLPATPVGSAAGDLTATWTAGSIDAVTASATTRLSPGESVSPDEIPVGGELSLQLRGRDWEGESTARLPGLTASARLSGAVEPTDWAASTIAGDVWLEAGDLARVRDRLQAILGDAGEFLSAEPLVDSTGAAAARVSVRGSVGDVTVAGELRIDDARVADLAGGVVEATWEASVSDLRVDRLEARLGGTAVVASGHVDWSGNGAWDTWPAAATLAIEGARLDEWWPIVVGLGELDAEAVQSPAGLLHARLDLTGPVARARGTGTLTVRDARVGDVAGGTIDADFELTAAGLRIDRAIAAFPAGRLSLEGTVEPGASGWADGRPALDLELDEVELDRWWPVAAGLATSIPERPAGLAGTLGAAARIEGTVVEPRVRGRLDLDAAGIGDHSGGTATGTWELTDGTLTVETFEAALAEATLRLDGTLRTADRSVEAAVTFGLDRLQPFVRGLPAAWQPSASLLPSGAVEADLRVSGLLDALAVGGSFRARQLVIGELPEVDLDGRFTPLESGTRIDALTLTGDDLEARLVGEIRGLGDRLDLALTATAARLGSILDPWLPDVDGRLEIEAALTGSTSRPLLELETTLSGLSRYEAALPAVRTALRVGAAWDEEGTLAEAILNLDRLAIDSPRFPLRLAEPAGVTWSPPRLEVRGLRLTVGDAAVEIDGSLGSADDAGILATLDAELRQLDELATAARELVLGSPAPDVEREPVRLDGRATVRARLTGSTEAPRVDGTVSVRGGSVAGLGIGEIAPVEVDVELGAGGIEIRRLEASWQGARISARGAVPTALSEPFRPFGITAAPDTSALEIEFGPLTPEALEPFVAAPWLDDVELVVDGRARIAGSGPEIEDLRGEVSLTQARIGYRDLTLGQVRPTRVSLADGRVEIVDWQWFSGLLLLGNPQETQRIALAGTFEPRPGGAVDLRVETDLDLGWASIWVPDGAIDGIVRGKVSVAGTVAQPRLEGSIALSGVEVLIREPRVAVTGVDGTLTLSGSRIRADNVSGEINGSRAQLFLEASLEDPARPRGLAGVVADAVPIESGDLRGLADLDLSLSVAGLDDARVFGSVTLQDSVYRTRAPLTTQLLRSMRGATDLRLEPSLLDDLRYDIRVTTGRDLSVDTPYAELSVSLDAQLVGTFAQPGLLGEARILDGGEAFLAGNNYSLQAGSIEFTDGNAIEPVLDIRATTQRPDGEIAVGVTGSAWAPRLELSSDPPMDESDILSVLTTGRTADAEGGLGGNVVASQALGYLTGEYLASFGRQLGFDRVRVERVDPTQRFRPDPSLLAADADLASRLTLARRITSAFELVLSQSLTDTDARTWVGTYDLPWNLTARGSSFDDEQGAFELTHSLRIGGSASRARPGQDVRVRNVMFSGDPGFDETALVERLRLEPGDRFDAFTWQSDRDRLKRLYDDRGHYEARVRPRRIPVEADVPATVASEVDLEYAIERGPATTFVISGFEASRRLERRVREIWSESIVNLFLVADIEAGVREHLVERGWVLADVSASTETTGRAGQPDSKLLSIRIDRGPRPDRREIVFSGNHAIDAETLRDELDTRGVRDAVWFEPQQVSRAIEEIYRVRGIPGVVVTVGTPELDGQTASVQVAIVERPVVEIARVEVTGADQVAVADIVAASGMTTGATYTPDTLSAGLRAVEQLYAARGFWNTEVTADASLQEADRTVFVAIDVVEGARQRVRTVEIQGNRHTRQGLIQRTLGIDAGDRLTSDRLSSARQRLYSLGVFTTVSLRAVPAGAVVDGVQEVALRVTVREVAPIDLRYGLLMFSDIGGLTDEREYDTGLIADLRHGNVFGRALSVGVAAQIRQNTTFARVLTSVPRTLGAPIRTTVAATRSQRDESAEGFLPVRFMTNAVTLEQRWTPGRRLRLGYSFNFERNATTFLEVDPDDPFFPENESFDIFRVVPTLIYDSRDERFDPTRGLFHSSTLEWSAKGLGSDLGFRKYHFRQYGFFRVGPVILASSVRFGTGVTNDPISSDLIPSELFRAGGGISVRGYEDDSLGFLEFFGSRIPGGNSLLIINEEARVRLWGPIGGVVFFDAGSAFRSVADIGLGSLKYSVGAGLRVDTPLVLLRLDYGLRLSDLDDQPRGGRFHFGIGHVF